MKLQKIQCHFGRNYWLVGVAFPPGRKPCGLEAGTIDRVIAVKNRSHNPKTTDTKLQSFFFDQTGRSRPEAALTPEIRYLKPCRLSFYFEH
jgi:hypothetical protein